jgi:phosphotransferase system HPr-like phosphotransfer protein
MSLGIIEGQEVTISAEGEDAQQAVDELSGFLLNKHTL